MSTRSRHHAAVHLAIRQHFGLITLNVRTESISHTA